MSNAVIVNSTTQRLILNPATGCLSLINAGPPGPPGPPGANGTAIAYEYSQAIPSASHVINHNLGYKPNVHVEELGTGDDIWCGIIHHSTNQVELQFNISRAIEAHLS